MSYLSAHHGYQLLIDRLHKYPQGAPHSELFMKILALLFSEKEARLVSQVPFGPFSSARAALLWQLREVEAARILEGLADRSLMLDLEQENGEKLYLLPPPISGFLKYALMRVKGDASQEALSELLKQYLNVEDDFVRSLLGEGTTRLGRILVDEGSIQPQQVSRVLDYERASAAIRAARAIAVGTCACRHTQINLGRGCSADLETCLVFDSVAESLVRHGSARQIDAVECLDILQRSREQGLVQFAENAQSGISFLCNCCSCCCDQLAAARKFCNLHPVLTSNYLVRIKRDQCSGCGKCVDACPVEAIGLVSAHDPLHRWQRRAVLAPARCLGCGVCVRACSEAALFLVPRPERLVTPVDGAHRVVQMAIEGGKLQNLVWDNQALTSHRALAAILGVILRLPALQHTLAKSQLGSRYVDALVRRQATRVERELAMVERAARLRD